MGKTHEALEKAEKEFQRHRQRISQKYSRDAGVKPFFIGPAHRTNFKRYEDLKNNLLARDGSITSILFIDTSCGGGSSAHAFKFATALAMESDLRVLLVDLNLWTLRLNEVFKIDDALGLSDLFGNSGKVASKITKVGPGNLYTVRWGGNDSGSVGLFASRRFGEFVKMGRKKFNYLILNAPTTADFSVCRALCDKVDGVVLVLEAGRIGRQVALKANQKIGKTGDKLLGVLLDKKRVFNPQLTLIASMVVAICLVFIAGFFLGNARFNFHEGRSNAMHHPVRVQIVSQANGHDKSLAQSKRNPMTQNTVVQEMTLSNVPEEKNNRETGLKDEEMNESQKLVVLSMEAKKEEPASMNKPALDKRDKVKPERARLVVVGKGDTLFKIINRAYGKYDEDILKAVLGDNPGIQSVDRISEGQVIKLPPLEDSS